MIVYEVRYGREYGISVCQSEVDRETKKYYYAGTIRIKKEDKYHKIFKDLGEAKKFMREWIETQTFLVQRETELLEKSLCMLEEFDDEKINKEWHRPPCTYEVNSEEFSKSVQ
jgi:hypothetical protein